MTKNYLLAKNISYETPFGKIINGVSFGISEDDHIGLIGKNGSGKTTLLKILTEIIKPTNGFLDKKCRLYYLPQIEFALLNSNLTIKEYMDQCGVKSWEVKKKLEQKFNLWNFDFETKISTLSGGELMKLMLSIGLASNPNLLLLDEPTNHLDLPAIEVLRFFLINFKGAYVVVSHDPLFLDHVITKIWELKDGQITHYGGSYSDYQKQKDADEESKRRSLEVARKEVGKLKKSLQMEVKRSARSEKIGRIMAHGKSMSKMEIGYFKNRASDSKGILHKKLTDKIERIETKAKNIKFDPNRKLYILFKENLEKEKRILINIDGANLFVNDLCLINDIQFSLKFGERIHIAGANGSGKSCFVKAISTINYEAKLIGKYNIANNIKVVYLSQKYELVNPDLTLLQNITSNDGVTYEQARQQLGNYLFKNENINKLAKELSGGEVARLALAIVTSKPADLLILDEPTNNLDIETINIFANSLLNYPGTIIAISHNIDFLDRINIEKSYIISNKKLILMNTIPHAREEFYQEILMRLTHYDQ